MVLLINQIWDAVALLKLDKIKMAHVSESTDAKKWGFVILAVPLIVNVFLASLIFPSGFGGIFRSIGFWTMIIPTLALVGSIFGMSLLAERFFKGSGMTALRWPFFKVLAYASIVFWLTPVSLLLDVIGFIDYGGLLNLVLMVGMIWVFVVAYNFLIHQRHMTQKDASLTVIGGVLMYFILQLILGNILIGEYYKVFY